jgi:drug/metabolite transporter (DMT)-like permease
MAAAFGLIGVLLVLQPDRGILSLASLLALGMGLSFSLHLTLSRVLRVEHPLANLFYTGFGVFVPLCFVVPFLWQPPSLTSLAGMAFIGVVGALGLFAFARSAELAPMPVVAGFAYTEVIFTMLFNAVLFHELPGRMMLLGGLVIAGVVGYLFIHELRTHEAR